MNNQSKKINQISVKELVATLNFYVQIIFNEPTKNLQPIKIKSRYTNK